MVAARCAECSSAGEVGSDAEPCWVKTSDDQGLIFGHGTDGAGTWRGWGVGRLHGGGGHASGHNEGWQRSTLT